MPRENSFARTAVTFLFLAILVLFCIGTIALEKDAISLQEKRQLAQFPVYLPTVAQLADWTKAVDEYLRDHFLFRDNLIGLNALLRLRLFNVNKSQNWIVLPGEDGWLFYLGDWALHDYLRKPSADDEQLVLSWEKVLARRQYLLKKKNANYLVVIAPNKEYLYSEYFPKRFRSRRGTTMLDLLRVRMNASPDNDHFLDLTEPLRQAKNTAQIYFKTDTHWNDRGAYVAYRAIMERIQHWHPEAVAVGEERLTRYVSGNSFGGDLVLAMGLNGIIAESNEILQIKQPCANPKDSIITHNSLPDGQSLEQNGCQTGIPLRVLIISDSFVESMRNFFAETFQHVVYSREVVFAQLRSFIDEYQPDIVLDLRVARNLPKVMSPGQDEER